MREERGAIPAILAIVLLRGLLVAAYGSILQG